MDLALERRAFALLREALEQEPALRSAFVDTHCGDDDALRARLGQLLKSADATSGVLDGGAAQLAARLQAADEDLPAGTHLGPWRVLRELGRGGMGAVYLAERDGDGFTQRGAIKLVKRGMDSAEVLARFRRERQILAQLHHPRIARLLDGGMSQDGRPWLAMEHVSGEPLSSFAARDEVGIAARVQVLLALADAVAHAHRHLVVHRDLKPSNVLVDGEGMPHLLDFGIARLLEDTDESERTATAARFLTRAYAAPEQERGESAGTATDVYQLGVLAFELLSGARFHGNAAATARPTERLSAARAALGADGPAAVSPRALRGDLGVIVARATDAEPTRRYASVDAFAEDLRRWRDGRAILARSDSPGYRAWRFVVRHKLGVAAAAGMLAAILVGSGVALWQAQRAHIAAERALVVDGFLEDIFSSIDPANARGRTVTAAELVDAAAPRIDRELAAQPAAAAQLHATLGRTYVALGDYAKGEAQLRRALTLVVPEQGELAIRTLADLADVRIHGGDLAEAQRLIESADQQRRRERPDDAALFELLLGKHAWLAAQKGDAAGALALGAQQLEHVRQRLGADAVDTIAAEQSHAQYLNEMARPAEAVRAQRHVLDSDRVRLGGEHPDVARDLHQLGLFQSFAGENDAAMDSIDEALRIRRKVLPPNHPETARTLGAKAQLLTDTSRAPESLPLWAQAVEMLRAQEQPDRPELATVLNNWGTACYQAGDFACAEQRVQEALTIWQRDLPGDHTHVLSAQASLAAMQINRGDLAGSEARLRGILAIRAADNSVNADSESTARNLESTRELLATSLRYQRRYAEELQLARQAQQDVERVFRAPNQVHQSMLNLLGRAEADAGEFASAALHAQAARAEARQLLAQGSKEEAWAELVLALAALGEKRLVDAEAAAQRSVAMYTQTVGENLWRTGEARGVLGLVLAASGQPAPARRELDAGIAILEKQRPFMPVLKEMRDARRNLRVP